MDEYHVYIEIAERVYQPLVVAALGQNEAIAKARAALGSSFVGLAVVVTMPSMQHHHRVIIKENR